MKNICFCRYDTYWPFIWFLALKSPLLAFELSTLNIINSCFCLVARHLHLIFSRIYIYRATTITYKCVENMCSWKHFLCQQYFQDWYDFNGSQWGSKIKGKKLKGDLRVFTITCFCVPNEWYITTSFMSVNKIVAFTFSPFPVGR